MSKCAVATYKRFIDAEVACPRASPLDERNQNDRRILGTDDFAAKRSALPGDLARVRHYQNLLQKHASSSQCLRTPWPQEAANES